MAGQADTVLLRASQLGRRRAILDRGGVVLVYFSVVRGGVLVCMCHLNEWVLKSPDLFRGKRVSKNLISQQVLSAPRGFRPMLLSCRE